MENGISQKEKSFKLKATLATATMEIAGGSLLHSFGVPLAGHFLSLHQLAWQSWLYRMTLQPNDVLECATTTALLKPSSPSSKKLTPMLAIQAQGTIHYAIIRVVGGYWGNIFGITMASLWAFIQPLLIVGFVFSPAVLLESQHKSLEKIFSLFNIDHPLRTAILIYFGFVAVKAVLAATLAHLTWSFPGKSVSLLEQTRAKIFDGKEAGRAFLKENDEIRNSHSSQPPTDTRNFILLNSKQLIVNMIRALRQPVYLIGLFTTFLILYISDAALSDYFYALLKIVSFLALAQIILQLLPLPRNKFPLLREVQLELSRNSKS